MGPSFLVVDDEPAIVMYTTGLLRELVPDADIHTAGSLGEALATADRIDPPAYVLLDLNLEDASRFRALDAMRARLPNARIVVMTATDDDHIRKSLLDRGAYSYVSKRADFRRQRAELQSIVMHGSRVAPDVRTGSRDPSFDWIGSLTEAELEVLRLMAQSLSNKEISKLRSCGEACVKRQATAIYRKAGLAAELGNKRVELANRAREYFRDDLDQQPRAKPAAARRVYGARAA